MPNAVQTVDLARSRFPLAAATLARAFRDDPLWRYVFPGAEARKRSLYRLWRGVLHFSRVYGGVRGMPEAEGVACWVAPGRTAMSLWQQMRTGMDLPRAVLSFERHDRRRFLSALMGIDRLHGELVRQPHWYLLALGVAPEHQRRGIGGSLLESALDRSAGDGLPWYLDTQSEANVAFYAKRGFVVIHEGVLPGHPVRTWMMVRRPRLPAGSLSSSLAERREWISSVPFT